MGWKEGGVSMRMSQEEVLSQWEGAMKRGDGHSDFVFFKLPRYKQYLNSKTKVTPYMNFRSKPNTTRLSREYPNKALSGEGHIGRGRAQRCVYLCWACKGISGTTPLTKIFIKDYENYSTLPHSSRTIIITNIIVGVQIVAGTGVGDKEHSYPRAE